MSRTRRNSRNGRGGRDGSDAANTGGNLPPNPPSSNNTNPPPDQPSEPTPAQSLGQTILRYLEGSHIQQRARRLHRWLWIGIVIFYFSQLFAGVIDILFGHEWMLVWEAAIAGIIGYYWSLPEIIAAGIAISIANAANDPTILSDAAIKKTLAAWLKGFLNICAYTIGIVVTVLLIFEAKNSDVGYGSMAGLLILGIFLGVVTGAIGKGSDIALRIAQAGIIGCIVKILILHIPEAEVDSFGETIRDILISHATFISVAVIAMVLAGTANSIKTKDWLWDKVTWFFSIKNWFKLAGLFLVLFVIYFLISPKEASEKARNKAAEIKEATGISGKSVDQPATPQAKVSSGPVGGSVAMSELREVKLEKHCNNLITEKTYTPGEDTWPTLIKDADPGTYNIIVTGNRRQGYFDGTNSIPSYFRNQDSDGNILDNSDGKVTQFFGQYAPFPKKAYAAFMIKANDRTVIAGSDYKFSTTKKVIIKMGLNVPDNMIYYNTDGSFNVKLYQCEK